MRQNTVLTREMPHGWALVDCSKGSTRGYYWAVVPVKYGTYRDENRQMQNGKRLGKSIATFQTPLKGQAWKHDGLESDSKIGLACLLIDRKLQRKAGLPV